MSFSEECVLFEKPHSDLWILKASQGHRKLPAYRVEPRNAVLLCLMQQFVVCWRNVLKYGLIKTVRCPSHARQRQNNCCIYQKSLLYYRHLVFIYVLLLWRKKLSFVWSNCANVIKVNFKLHLEWKLYCRNIRFAFTMLLGCNTASHNSTETFKIQTGNAYGYNKMLNKANVLSKGQNSIHG